MSDTEAVTELLAPLQLPGKLEIKLNALHRLINHRFPIIKRIGIALYDAQIDQLRTYLYSAEQRSPLKHYSAKLSDCYSLKDIRQTGLARIINDMEKLANSGKQHAELLYQAGYLSSYTIPMNSNGQFLGFIFFDALEKNAFSEEISLELNMLGEMLTLMIYNDSRSIYTLKATLKSALDITRDRDPETAEHLERMSRFSLLIATALAEQYGFDDQTLEQIFRFAPLHDLGKIRVPDRILLKQGLLTSEEREEMKLHPKYGLDLLERLLSNHGLKQLDYIQILKNIVLHHHERYDGSGYPHQLEAQDIPIEARIIAVADVFDALTSTRPYKGPWTNKKAFAYLEKHSGQLFDPDCINALLQNKHEVINIQRTFNEGAGSV